MTEGWCQADISVCDR